jgi:hypothetical protein
MQVNLAANRSNRIARGPVVAIGCRIFARSGSVEKTARCLAFRSGRDGVGTNEIPNQVRRGQFYFLQHGLAKG